VSRPPPPERTEAQPLQWLASLAFTAFLFASTFVFASLVLLFGWLPPPRRYAIVRAWAATELAVLRWVCGLDYRVEGREHLPASGGHISMWKHSSAWETLAQALIMPPQAWVLKREILWIPLIGWATWLMQPIAIDRRAGHAAVNQVVQQGRARLAAGLWVLVFPEGTRVPVGQTKKYGVSGALLAAAAGCKVVPVAHNAGRYWGRRGLLKKRGTIRVVIGPPIEAAGREPRAINEEVRAWIDSTVARLGA